MFPLHTLHFETVPDPGAGGGESAPVAPEGDAWAPPQEEWTQTLAAVQYLAEQEEARAAAAQAENGEPELDLYGENPAEEIRRLIREEMAPLSEFTEQSRFAEADQRALDIIADLEVQGGDFLGKAAEGEQLSIDSRKVARTLADSFWPEARERYGDTPQAAEAALAKGVEAVRALEETIGKAYANRQQNQLHTLAGARREPAAAGTTGAGEITPRGGDENDVLQRFFPMR